MRSPLYLVAAIASATSLFLFALAVGGQDPVPARDADLVAEVNGRGISRETFERYAAVLTDPNGVLRTSQDQVLLSVVNQDLVAHVAKRLGVVVDEADVDDAVEAWESLNIARSSLASSGGIEGLRERFGAFIEFSQVKSIVVGTVVVGDDQITGEYLNDPGLLSIPFDDSVAATIRERVARREGDRRWEEWLKVQRDCSVIVIHDRSFSMTSSTPRPGCDSIDR